MSHGFFWRMDLQSDLFLLAREVLASTRTSVVRIRRFDGARSSWHDITHPSWWHRGKAHGMAHRFGDSENRKRRLLLLAIWKCLSINSSWMYNFRASKRHCRWLRHKKNKM